MPHTGLEYVLQGPESYPPICLDADFVCNLSHCVTSLSTGGSICGRGPGSGHGGEVVMQYFFMGNRYNLCCHVQSDSVFLVKQRPEFYDL